MATSPRALSTVALQALDGSLKDGLVMTVARGEE